MQKVVTNNVSAFNAHTPAAHTAIDPPISSGQAITVANVTKSWDGTKAVDGVSIDIPAGTFTVLLGPSGCGKSTTLRIIAGLEFADSGSVSIGDNDVTDATPVKRNLAMVFQSYALFPHLNVAENILFGLKVRRVQRKEQLERLQHTAEMLGLGDYLKRKPAQLSGGQQQRVALGRAIIAEKPVCLMDEPLSNLDAKLRNSMRSEIRELQQKLGFSMVYVTHDQAEAITMADQVVVMREGRVEQAGSPREIYEHPATSFVAGFIGTPPMNLIDSTSIFADQNNNSGQTHKDSFIVGVRPENIRIGSAGISASVIQVEYMGADLLVECRVADNYDSTSNNGQSSLLARVSGSHQVQIGQRVNLQWDSSATHIFSSDTRQRIEAPPAALLEQINQLLENS